MHDLMHDLAISVAGGFYSRTEELGEINKIQIQTRHLSYGRLSYPIRNNFNVVEKLKSLRTFLPIDFRNPSFSIENIALIILSKFKCLRVLSFSNFCELEIMPDSIGDLIHLHYLDLSWTGIKTLPESLSNLYNLQTLKLRGCNFLVTLPSGMQNLMNLRHLNINGTRLKEMPPGISKLKQLQVLSDFVVGKHEKNGIKELGELSNIHGSLHLKNLENVTTSGEAEEARIKDKTHIQELTLEWSSDKDMVTTSHFEREIVDKLQPHKGLEVLIIFSCCMLPSLGQLPHLKFLRIENLDTVETIGDEFYKNDNDASSLETPFPSLEELCFGNMSSWEAWHSSQSFSFPQLKHLKIINCPSLKGDLPRHLPVLKRLDIMRCPKLIDLPDGLRALETLEIDGCEQLFGSLLHAPAIRDLRISNSNGVGLQEIPISLQYLSIKGCQLVESMLGAIPDTQLTCLQSLIISDCSCALSISGDCLPESLKDLRFVNCKNIELPNQHKLLESLKISDSCDLLTAFSLDAFPNLEVLDIIGCLSLQSLSVSPLQSKASVLGRLFISDCPNFVGFPTEGLAAPNLTSFYLRKCPMLKSLPSHMNTLISKLEFLEISDCPKIDAFPEGGLPPNLKTLEISYLRETSLHIGGASSESFNSFPKEGLLPQLPSLSTLRLHEFGTMETLNCNGLLHLTSLEVLEIRGCPKLNNIVGERLPLSLIKLRIFDTPLLEERCQKKHPQIWHKISHIPGIQLNWRWVSRC